MATFNDFVQIELPKRPFTEVDGLPGQILVRSPDVNKPRELVWADALIEKPLVLKFEAAHDVSGHRVLTVNENGKAIYAENHDQLHCTKIIGISTSAALAGTTVPVVREGIITEPSWSWTPGTSLFLGLQGYITNEIPSTPASQFLLYVGFATSSTSILISFGTPVILT